jgi:hypothetical protein
MYQAIVAISKGRYTSQSLFNLKKTSIWSFFAISFYPRQIVRAALKGQLSIGDEFMATK